MKLCRYRSAAGKDCVGIVDDARIVPLSLGGPHYKSLADILESEDAAATAQLLIDAAAKPVALDGTALLPPVDHQEIWAAGVTYKRSRAARMEESEIAADVYQRVYDAPRPELFFKSMPHRVVGPDKPVRIRADGQWNVPEPELVLVLNSRMELVAFTIGNDMSCRDIEGDNPLYLPQAKIYDQSCAMGPWVTLASGMPPASAIGIRMAVVRSGDLVFEGSTSTSQLSRTFDDLIDYLGRDNTFRDGVCLFTGTGIVPEAAFSLRPGDTIDIAIDGIGTLINTVVQGR
jgi:2-dehydro-3-deoxy-D-arabinonate dehydratase